MMVNFVERLRQIYGAKVSCAATSDMAVNNIADCPDSKTTSNAFLKSKLVICGVVANKLLNLSRTQYSKTLDKIELIAIVSKIITQ